MKIIKDNPEECIIAFYKNEVEQACLDAGLELDKCNIYKISKALFSLYGNVLKRTVYYKVNKNIVPKNLFNLKGIFIINIFKDKNRNMLLDEAVHIQTQLIDNLHYSTDEISNLISFVKLLDVAFDYVFLYKNRYYINTPLEYIDKFQLFSKEFMLTSSNIDMSVLIEHGTNIINKKAAYILKSFY